jgi:hypothetical protein
VPFADRLDSLQPSQAGDSKATPAALNNSCFPDSQFKAFGFYTLGPDSGAVNFGVYSRVQYYSLTPQWDGDIVAPQDSVECPLTPRQQTVGILTLVDGLTSAEIADMLGISVHAVNTHRRAVVRALREALLDGR